MGKTVVTPQGCGSERGPVLLGSVSMYSGMGYEVAVSLARPLGDFKQIIMEAVDLCCVSSTGIIIYDKNKKQIGYLYASGQTGSGSNGLSILFGNKLTGRGLSINHQTGEKIVFTTYDPTSTTVYVLGNSARFHSGNVRIYGIE